MCRLIDNELFDNIIVGEYWSMDNKLVKGAYTTKADDAIVVNINLFERLLSGIKIIDSVSSDFTLEDAEKKFGEEIVKRYLSKHGVDKAYSLVQVDKTVEDQIIAKQESESTIDNKSKNVASATKANVEKGNQTQAMILKLIFEGVSQQEIVDNFDFSRATIGRALKDLDEQQVRVIWNKYRTSVFDGVDMGLMEGFILSNCNYKEYRKRLVMNNEASFRKTVNKQVEEMKDFNFYADKRKEYSNMLEELGFSPLRGTNRVIEEAPVEEDSEIARVMAIINQPVPEVVKPQVKKPVENDKFADMYAKKMSKLDNSKGVVPVSSPRRGFKPRTKAGITSAGSYNSVGSEMHTIEEE